MEDCHLLACSVLNSDPDPRVNMPVTSVTADDVKNSGSWGRRCPHNMESWNTSLGFGSRNCAWH